MSWSRILYNLLNLLVATLLHTRTYKAKEHPNKKQIHWKIDCKFRGCQTHSWFFCCSSESKNKRYHRNNIRITLDLMNGYFMIKSRRCTILISKLLSPVFIRFGNEPLWIRLFVFLVELKRYHLCDFRYRWNHDVLIKWTVSVLMHINL